MKKIPCKNLLIITSSGGNGLLQAAIAKEQEVRKENPNVRIIKKDMMLDWFGKPFGNYAVKRWNNSQKRGDIKDQENLVSHQALSEKLFWISIFRKAYKVLVKEDVDRVIDTQPIGVHPIIKALRLYNRKSGKNVILEKIIVDLPTSETTHFFPSIKKLSSKDRKYLELYTIDPLLEENQTKKAFWLQNCKLPEEQVHYQYFFIRDDFKKYQNVEVLKKPYELKFLFHNSEEKSYLQKAASKGAIEVKIEEAQACLILEPQDRLFSIMLGSNPTSRSVLTYIEKFIQLSRKTKQKQRNFVCMVFCANHQPGTNSLYKQVSETIETEKDYPSNLKVIPLSFQKEAVIAPIFHRSDVTLTRSGGHTAMELMAVMKGEMFIHSESKGANLSLKELLKGIPCWESASALYLQKKWKAKIANTDSFFQLFEKYFNE